MGSKLLTLVLLPRGGREKMVKKAVLGCLLVMLLSMVIVLLVGTVAFAAAPPASCAAHCATSSGGSGHGVSAWAKDMGGPGGIAQMGTCPSPDNDCCLAWEAKFAK